MRDSATEIDGEHDTGTNRLRRYLQRSHDVVAVDGRLVSGDGVDRATRFLLDDFDPHAKLIVYGYSVGGMDAVSLCWRIQQQYGAFDLQRRRFLSMAPSGSSLAVVRVDLLITVDATNGRLQLARPYQIPETVRRNVNYYQTVPTRRTRAHGHPHRALRPGLTEVVNHDLTSDFRGNPGAAHANIDEAVFHRVVTEIQRTMRT